MNRIVSKTEVLENIKGTVERVTYHNEVNGWSVLKVTPLNACNEIITITVHQTRFFAGATMQFEGNWTTHPRFGKQFKARYATEIKPATAGALEKYLGSGLIKGVGPKTARKIVSYFKDETLDVFECNIHRLTEVPGIATKKLSSITSAWEEHKAVRDVMMFLQSYGISTLFAVRIYKQYGDEAINIVRNNPYRLARDFFGIGFFTADKVALSLGFSETSQLRISAAISHVLSASRESGDCYLTDKQISDQVCTLIQSDVHLSIPEHLVSMEAEGLLRVRYISPAEDLPPTPCYYARSIYYDETYVAEKLINATGGHSEDLSRAADWLHRYCRNIGMELSKEQTAAVLGIINQRCSILTGGPGCGKTTVTKVISALLKAMGRSVLLAAPTGRAAQRMEEVIGMEAKTIHRLLEFKGNGFTRNEDNPLKADFLIVDECSMLDLTLSASLLRAVEPCTSLLFIGDADQLPSVGPGNVLKDCIASGVIPCYQLKTVFRQASHSHIIKTAHRINRGEIPQLESPFKKPELWKTTDCFFIDSEEATRKQLRFIEQVRRYYADIELRESVFNSGLYGTIGEGGEDSPSVSLSSDFAHIDPSELASTETTADALLILARKTHPWSSLYYGLTALDVILRLYSEWVPKYLGKETEIQVLAPMIKGSLGTANLNTMLQQTMNPPEKNKPELTIGERVFRPGDRVIHRRNNYDLKVFNGDIGRVEKVDNSAIAMHVLFESDGRLVEYSKEQIAELELAYAVTVHKSQGSEFDVVILPVVTQHFKMLYRNLLYTGVTRGRKLVILVGTRKALAMTVHNSDTSQRQTALCKLLQGVV